MPGFQGIPRSGGADTVTPSGEVWDRVAAMLEKVYNMSVAAPLEMHDHGQTRCLAVHATDGGAATFPEPQYEGQCWIGVSNNVAAFAYPFAVDTV